MTSFVFFAAPFLVFAQNTAISDTAETKMDTAGDKRLEMKTAAEERKAQVEDRVQSATRGAQVNIETVKTRMLAHLSKIEEFLTNLKTRVSAMEDWDEEVKSALLARIDGHFAWLSEQKAAIESVATLEELRTVMTEIKSAWQARRGVVQLYVGVQHVQKARRMYEKVESFYNRLVAELGVDNANLQAMRAALDTAQELYSDALEKALSTAPGENQVGTVAEVRSILKSAFDSLKKGIESGRAALEEIKEQQTIENEITPASTSSNNTL